MKGKIKTIAPKLISGVQEQFTFKDRTYYVFQVTVEIDGNLHLGDANSTTMEPKWKTDVECEVDMEKNDKATNGNRFRFSFGDRPGGSGTGRAFGRPVEERMEIISQSSYASAVEYMKLLPEEERKVLIDKYGPDGAYPQFANKISDEVMDNAIRLKEKYGS